MENQTLLSVKAAKERILEEFAPKPSIKVLLKDGGGYVLSKDIHAPMDLPPFNNSSMDGFALISADTVGANPSMPIALKVIEDIPAGKKPKNKIFQGQTARIMTGAVLPEGADAVIPVELTNLSDRYNQPEAPEEVLLYKEMKAGENVRLKGMDIQKGDSIFNCGHVLKPHDLGFLSALGITHVEINPAPLIGLFSSGDEITTPGKPLSPGQIYDVNSISISSLLRNFGAKVIELGTAPDNYRSVQQLMDKALEFKVDLIVSTAGVSMGAYDFVKQVLEENGSLHFWKVNMRPGKPLTFGCYRNTPFIGLPGNPVSAYVSSRIFIKAIINKFLGLSVTEKTEVAFTAEDIDSDGRESYLRVKIEENEGKFIAKLAQHQGSGNMYSLVCANALLIVPAGVKSLPKGTRANFIPL